jgi:alkylhydroperoxidase family enzyme
MLPEKVLGVLARVLESAGESAPSLRRAVMKRAHAASRLSEAKEKLPDALVPYVEKVAERPATVDERDLQTLRESGLSDEQIFELTIAAAMGASLARYERGLSLLSGESVAAAVRR